MNWKQIARDYLHFTRKDRIGILIIVFVMLFVIFFPYLMPTNRTQESTTLDTAVIAALKQLDQDPDKNHENESTEFYPSGPYRNNNYNSTKVELFYFDPNTLSPDGWKKLGLREKTIGTIQNYLGKGGHFKKAGDLERVYGLRPDEYERLAPYIRIPVSVSMPAIDKNISLPARDLTPRYAIIDINTADTSAFISLPGIGSKLAARIVSFRDKLGGFYSIGQIGETFGLPDSTFQKIKQYLKLEDVAVKKININTATVDELKMHPYIRWTIANPLVAYRTEHGPFLKLEDLKNVMAITDDVYNKIIPYLVLQ